MFLNFEVSSPTELQFGTLFKMNEHALTVDQIIRTKALYLQRSNPLLGRHVNLESHRILVGVGAGVPVKDWEKKLFRIVLKKFRKHGTPRAKAKIAAKNYIEEMRKFGSWRQK